MNETPRASLVTMMLTALTVASAPTPAVAGDFGDDVAFLRQHTPVVVLRDRAGLAQVALAPAWQGRVMTSTAAGERGSSFGWINRDLIRSGQKQPHINVYGGEDRFWLGPEGGQYSIFFAPGAKFEDDDWYVPPALDTMPYSIVRQRPDRATFAARFGLTNYSGARFDVRVNRDVRLLSPGAAWRALGIKARPGVGIVAFESDQRLTNAGPQPWRRETGLLSIWILGMLNASADSTVVIPFESGPEGPEDLKGARGPKVKDTYFGKVPADRLVVRDDVLFFRADARYRSKIGIPPARAKPILGSYDAASRTLTLVRFTLPRRAADYVNSMWTLQADPFRGDVVNSYNDDGKLGAFFELETSSPALALRPGASARHRHQTIHLQGPESDLDAIARATLGVPLEAIRNAFTP